MTNATYAENIHPKYNALVYDCGGQIVRTWAEAEAYTARTGRQYKVKYEPVKDVRKLSPKVAEKRIKIK